jgi:hypothetical protein
LIQKIAWIFPEIEIEYSFADEDYGSSNCGFYRFKHDQVIEEREYELGSKDAYEMAFELVCNAKVPEWYAFNHETSTYECVED